MLTSFALQQLRATPVGLPKLVEKSCTRCKSEGNAVMRIFGLPPSAAFTGRGLLCQSDGTRGSVFQIHEFFDGTTANYLPGVFLVGHLQTPVTSRLLASSRLQDRRSGLYCHAQADSFTLKARIVAVSGNMLNTGLIACAGSECLTDGYSYRPQFHHWRGCALQTSEHSLWFHSGGSRISCPHAMTVAL